MQTTHTESLSQHHIELTERWAAHNYHPLPVVIVEGKGAWVTDADGKRYLDCLSGYSALNWGYSPERFLKTAHEQLDKLTLTSRAFMNDQLGVFCEHLAKFCGKEAVLPMTTGAEAVETAIKLSRRWGYEKKGVPEGKAEIITFERNFAGRTTTIVSFADPGEAKQNFGPYTDGFARVPYGDLEAVLGAITPNTVAVLIEPIQGEGGVNIPPPGYMKALREACTRENVLLIADEIQTGFCRTGKVFACEHEGIEPDLILMGKALGAGITPISAVAANWDVMEVFRPGSHGSTYGGNPLACAVAIDVLRYIEEEHPERRATELGDWLMAELRTQSFRKVKEVRGRGLMIGVEIRQEFGKAYPICEELASLGVLTKDTRSSTMRLTPPLMIEKSDLEWALDQLAKVLD
ncbi:MAG: ornithine--oxo-acid transaminase [Armatimonadetes bacterium]|nr:ornithine--oxo-acid transaminase [Armatimonadota bacterium]